MPTASSQYIEELVGDNAFTMPVYWEAERRGRDAEEPARSMKLKIHGLLLLLQADQPH